MRRPEHPDGYAGDRLHIERIAADVVDGCVKVHRALGPGLLESAYQRCLAYEIERRGWGVEREVPIPIQYGELRLEVGYRADMIVNGRVLIESKAVRAILPVHEAQVLTYLRISGLRLGFLIHWNHRLIRDGIRRFVSER